ncbi:8-oxo-dGTP diphosphatase MutT [Clostridium sp. D53t1_180928_C8]|uniref:8-oxo-dGTP diphosphatase MutT n=1 Tax=Clostridium sp. D53t1_180928_C8 TaxID=2787101 RepID=UPI0018ABBEC2|nr:8-oxo-dGTP diphosphatase MutT [Clostridium sp. D53t1_180928_C8]
MKTIEVVAAIIKKEEKIFITRRSYGEFKDMWEFPGGKIEAGETNEEALIREIKEELELDINNLEFLTTIEYDYPTFHLIMHCYTCEIYGGTLNLNVHNDAKWVSIQELREEKWIPADIDVVKMLIEATI